MRIRSVHICLLAMAFFGAMHVVAFKVALATQLGPVAVLCAVTLIFFAVATVIGIICADYQ